MPVAGVETMIGAQPHCVIAEEISDTALARALRDFAGQPRGQIPASAVAPYEARRSRVSTKRYSTRFARRAGR